MDSKLSHSIAEFAVKFCNELEKDKTTICSPLSAEIMLALLALGCKNQSHAELLKALDMTDDDAIRSSFGFLTSNLKTIERATLNMANKIYLKKDIKIKPEFLKDAEQIFESSLEQLDFEEKIASADTINEWVAHHTNNKIKSIVSPDMFSSQTNLVMVNAICFLGHWNKPFKKIFTKDRAFHINNVTTTQVAQMFEEKFSCGYGVSPELKSKIIEMHYQGDEASMVIILPDEIEGLNFTLDQLIAGYDVMADIANLKRQKVTVQLPKFKVEMTIDLKKLLTKLGVKSIFGENNSDIDMLLSNETLFVSEAIQKAYIEVDEKGTEATASTGVVYKLLCKRYYKRFIADRPFLYLLTARKIPLFIGVYRGIPTATE
ncbi:antichymotrypsin-2-like [Choristoneura fumiferana]|uniref:antichymotrypsin-2-like n=1 Tax=Choristoneura fumiferana TaxID=7141 RepID=UPI003D1574F4